MAWETPYPTRLVINLLGTWEVTVDGSPAQSFKYDKVRALLAYLVMEHERPHRRERLAGLLWPESPNAAARDGLRQALATLRRAISDGDARPPHLLSSRETLSFNFDSQQVVDANRFRELVSTTRRHGHRRLEGCPTCLGKLAQAAELYRGDFLAHFSLANAPEFESWLTDQREHLRRLAAETLDILTEHALRQADWPAAQSFARRLLDLEPWRENAHRDLMLALAQEGRRTEALAQFHLCRKVLEEEFNVLPESETLSLSEQIRLGDIGLLRPSGRFHSDAVAYQQLKLVGRQQELAQLLELVARQDTRLLTIAGPGGVGKTHLAAALAQQAQPFFQDGVAFISLAGLDRIEELPAAIASGLDLRFQGPRSPQTQLADYLSDRDLLLILDNFEHLRGEPLLLIDLIGRAPGVVLLVTSRHRLKLRHERVFPLRGLPFPAATERTTAGAETPAGQELEMYGAVQLFVRQVRRSHPGFEMGPAQRDAVAEICRLAEGVPLILELAAAMTAASNAVEVAARLANAPATVTESFHDLPERQRSLSATLDYAWQLLSPAERQTFGRLSVFRGAFDVAAATAVADTGHDELQALVDRSLLQTGETTNFRTSSPGAATTFALHPLARRYAHRRLAEQPPVVARIAGRHAAYFLKMISRSGPDASGDAGWSDTHRLRPALNDIRRAWRWAVNHRRADLLAPAVAGLSALLSFAGLYLEAEETFGAAAAAFIDRPVLAANLHLAQGTARQKLGNYRGALALADRILATDMGAADQSQVTLLRARARILRGHLLELLGEYDGALVELETALTLLPDAHPGPERADALDRIGSIQWRSSRYRQALDVFQAAMSLDEAAGRRHRLARHLGNLGLVYKDMGEYDRALEHLQRALATAEAQGHREDTARFSLNVGLVHWQMGRLEEAHDHYQRALALARALNHRRGTATCLANLGVVDRLRGRYESALAYYHEAQALAGALGEKALLATTTGNTGNVYMDMGRFDRAAELMLQAVAMDRKLGNEDGVARHLGNLGDLHKYQGDYVTAATYFDEALHLLRQSGNKYYLCWVLVAGADVALARAAEVPDATVLLSRAEAMNREGRTMAEVIGRREYVFAGEVLTGRLLAARGNQAGALARLRALLDDPRTPEEEAELYFALWQIGGREEARLEALRRFQTLQAKNARFLFQSRLNALRSN